MIYLDQAATSYPKSDAVIDAVVRYMHNGTSPGRAGHRLARWADGQVDLARERVARLMCVPDPARVVFGPNATTALNAVASHLARRGGTVLTSAFEHNSVTRPLKAFSLDGRIEHTVIPTAPDGPIDLDWLRSRLRRGDIRGVIMTIASNVTGTVLPIRQVARLCREHGVMICADAAQAAGYVPVQASDADVVVFAGHKGLGGPQGVGGAVVGPGVEIDPFIRGGSGGRSESPVHPPWLPWALEAGTANGPGIAGLAEALQSLDLDAVRERQRRLGILRRVLVNGLHKMPGVHVVDPPTAAEPTPVVSFFVDGTATSTIGELLEERWGILVRTGLHCAPTAHATVGTAQTGTVRMSLGSETTLLDVTTALDAVRELADERRDVVEA